MKILSQYGERSLKDFKTSRKNHGKKSVVGQPNPVEHNCLTVSETVTIDKTTGGYMEKMKEYRNSARRDLIALENKIAMERSLNEIIKDTMVKQKTYGTIVSLELHSETVDQFVSLPWREVLLRHFEKGMRTTARVNPLIGIRASGLS